MTTRQELHSLVDELSDRDAAEVLDYIHWLLGGSETLTSEELQRVSEGEEQLARGEYVTLDQLQRKLDR